MANSGETQKHRSPVNIISVDIGTTTISCHHLDQSGISVYQTSRKVRKIIAHSQLDFTLKVGVSMICVCQRFSLLRKLR